MCIRMGKTFKLVTGTVKRVATKPLSGCRLLFSRAFRHGRSGTPPPSIPPQKTTEDTPEVPPAEIHPVQMTKILRDVFQDPQTAHKYAKHLDKKVQAGSSCISGTRDKSRFRGPPEPPELKTLFQKLTTKAISPRRSTPGSVGYDVFTPIDFMLQPQEQKTIFVDLAITPPQGHYTQLMPKSGLAVLYELKVKAGVIDPDYTGKHRSGS